MAPILRPSIHFGGVVFYADRHGTNGEIMTLKADIVRPGKTATPGSGITQEIGESDVIAGKGFLGEQQDSYRNESCYEAADITEECFPPESEKEKIPERDKAIRLLGALIAKWWNTNAEIAPDNEKARIDEALKGTSINTRNFKMRAVDNDIVCFELTIRSVYP